MTSPLAVALGAGAGLVAGVLWWRWLRTGDYRLPGDTPRLGLRHSWWVAPGCAAVGAAAGSTPGSPGWAVAAWVYLVGAVALLWVDVDVHRIPDRITRIWGPLLAVAIAVSATIPGEWTRLLGGLWGGLALGALFLLAALLGSMGLGDVKLALITGLYLGALRWPDAVIIGVVATVAAGGIIAIGLLAAGRGKTAHMPYGPALILGALAATLQHGLSITP